jgi:hypothetical protein
MAPGWRVAHNEPTADISNVAVSYTRNHSADCSHSNEKAGRVFTLPTVYFGSVLSYGSGTNPQIVDDLCDARSSPDRVLDTIHLLKRFDTACQRYGSV